MSAQHTPGPWGFDPTVGSIYHDDGDVRPLVASVMTDCVSDEQAEADCRLIAAAPDMLAALKAMQADETIRAVCKSPLWATMANAIEKAEGRA